MYSVMLSSALVAYLVGAIPTGYWLVQWCSRVDIRTTGSGNIGATNVGRLWGPVGFLLVFALDALKAYAVMHALLLIPVVSMQPFAGYALAGCVLIGNAYSCFLAFSGGKGVATFVGVLCALFPWCYGVVFSAVWLVLLALTRAAWCASIGGAVVVTGCAVWTTGIGSAETIFLMLCVGWFVLRHSRNIITWYTSKKGTSS